MPRVASPIELLSQASDGDEFDFDAAMIAKDDRFGHPLSLTFHHRRTSTSTSTDLHLPERPRFSHATNEEKPSSFASLMAEADNYTTFDDRVLIAQAHAAEVCFFPFTRFSLFSSRSDAFLFVSACVACCLSSLVVAF